MKRKILLSLLVLFAFTARAQWVNQTVPFTGISYFSDVEATSQMNAWANIYMISGTSASATPYYAVTWDGGSTWMVDSIKGVPATYAISNVMPVDSDTAYVAMYNVPSGGGIYKTTDRGATWNRMGTADMFDATSFPNVVHFFDAQHGVAMGDPNAGSFEVWTTSDYGATWNRVAATDIPDPDAAGEYGIVNLYSAVDSTIWFATDIGNIYKSTDMGMTWTKSASGLMQATQTIEDIAFIDSAHGFIMQSGSLYHSMDGGLTWTQVNYTGPMFQFDIEPVPGTNTLVSTGSSSTSGAGSSYSQDMGMTWTLIDTAVSHTAVDFYDEMVGWSGEVADGTSGGAWLYNGMALAVPGQIKPSVVSVYPNPTTGVINVDLREINENVTITIYDVTGKEIVSKKVSALNNKSVMQFVLGGNSKGVHQVVIQGSNVQKTVRVIVQ